MARKKLIKFERNTLSTKKGRKLYVAIDPERVTKIVESQNYVTVYYGPKEYVYVSHDFDEVLDEINAPRA